jgi:hypothetical protein
VFIEREFFQIVSKVRNYSYPLLHFERPVSLIDEHADRLPLAGAMLGLPEVTAVEVADTAENFGQEDDISVITVARTAVLEPALV